MRNPDHFFSGLDGVVGFDKIPFRMSDIILIVEDEPDVIDLVRYHLHRAGFEVLTAFNGPAGLATATESRPDAILLDIMLPQMTGIEVCKALRNADETADIPILILTAKAELPDRLAGLELGVDDYITKPFSPRELVLRLQNLLRRLRVVRKSSVLVVDDNATNRRILAQQLLGCGMWPETADSARQALELIRLRSQQCNSFHTASVFSSIALLNGPSHLHRVKIGSKRVKVCKSSARVIPG